MQKLKLLPWFARRYGIAPERAAELWRQAVARADLRYGAGARTSEHAAYAMRSLLERLRCEGAALAAPCEVEQPLALPAPRSAIPLIDSQRRLGAATFDAAAAALHAANEYWSRALRVANARR